MYKCGRCKNITSCKNNPHKILEAIKRPEVKRLDKNSSSVSLPSQVEDIQVYKWPGS